MVFQVFLKYCLFYLYFQHLPHVSSALFEMLCYIQTSPSLACLICILSINYFSQYTYAVL